MRDDTRLTPRPLLPAQRPALPAHQPRAADEANANRRPTVAVIICCYQSMAYLPDCLGSLHACDDDDIDLHLIAVDNASTDGSAAYIRTHFPKVHVLALPENRGFTGGNNAGWDHVRNHLPDAEYVMLLNHDTVVTPGWHRPLIAALREHPDAACVQPKILLHPATHRINTAGNRSHYLGFGFMTGYDQPDDGQWDQQRVIDFASGAAVMIRTTVLHHIGLFDERMKAYLEDADLGWRFALAGWQSLYVPASRVHHKYVVKAPFRAYFLLERNRWWLILSCYRWRTLTLMLPALWFMEAGQWFFAWRQGLLRERLRVYGFYLRRSHWRALLTRRKAVQDTRAVGDRQFTAHFAGRIHFDAIDHPLLRHVANPLLDAWWKLIRLLIHW